MSYSEISQLPKHVKKYSVTIQRQWRHVFNTVYSNTKTESRAVKAANSVLKTRFKKRDSMVNNNRNDYFNHLVDRWLGNLNG